jgi:hypothetical protein
MDAGMAPAGILIPMSASTLGTVHDQYISDAASFCSVCLNAGP